MYIFAYLLDCWIIYEKSIKSLVCWSHLDSYRRVFVCLFPFVFFSAGLLKLNFNDTLVSSTHTFQIFVPVARIKLTTFRILYRMFQPLNRKVASSILARWAWFLLLPSWKCSLEITVCVLLTSVSLKLSFRSPAEKKQTGMRTLFGNYLNAINRPGFWCFSRK